MTFVGKALSSAIAVALVASAVVMSSAPAQAEGVGSGRAVIRIDAPTATVIKTGKHSYRMVLPEGTTGQWMGERPDAQGKQITRVGDLTAGKLANRWTRFRYAKAPVYTTLLWDAQSANPGVAVIMLDKPKVTAKGVRFDFTSRTAIPRSMSDVKINISRAPRTSDRTQTGVQDAVVSGTMVVWINVGSSKGVYGRIYDSNGPNCWGGSSGTLLNSTTPNSVGSGTCAGIPYQNYVTGSSPYGVALRYTDSYVLFDINVTPPGMTTYQYSHGFSF